MRVYLSIFVFFCAVAAVGCKWSSRNPNTNSGSGLTANSGLDVAGSYGTTNSRDASELYKQGSDLFDRDRDDEAAEMFRRALKIDPNYADAHFKLGLAYSVLDRKEEAREEFKLAVENYKKYLETKPDDADAQMRLGHSHAKLSQYPEAIRAFRQAAKVKKDDSDLYYEIGAAHIKLAQYQEAVVALSKAIELDPQNFRAEEALEDAKAGVSRIKSSVKHQQELIEKEKEKAANGNAAPSKTP